MKEAGIMSKIKKINRVLGYKMKKEITTRSPEALERMCCGLVTAWEGTGQKVWGGAPRLWRPSAAAQLPPPAPTPSSKKVELNPELSQADPGIAPGSAPISHTPTRSLA